MKISGHTLERQNQNIKAFWRNSRTEEYIVCLSNEGEKGQRTQKGNSL